MCGRGSWRGFHTRKIGGRLAIMEQCTECGSYRARAADDFPFVEKESDESTTDLPEDLPDPGESETDGSVWGPDSDSGGGW